MGGGGRRQNMPLLRVPGKGLLVGTVGPACLHGPPPSRTPLGPGPAAGAAWRWG